MATPGLSTRYAGPLGCSNPAVSFKGGRSQLHRSAHPAAAACCTLAHVRPPCSSGHQLSAASSTSSVVLRTCSGLQQQLSRSNRRRTAASPQASAGDGDSPPKNTEFGYSRKDIILLGAGLIGLGYALYYGLQAFGVEPAQAGNVVQITIFLGICIGYISTYIFRVANKDMTYVKQLEDYEEAVMARRLAEMPPDEVDRLMAEVESETEEREERKRRILEASQQQRADKQ